ncbi:hypothetical protein [Parafrankia sp. FMc2]|uniref:hypothetical protein n=1 Tax=Parafrankia sp. FMc2 TaxID=3233196 RepID=UPI0034D6D527
MSALTTAEKPFDSQLFSLGVEELESLEALFDWNGFWSGFRAGVAVVGVVGTGIGVGIAIT